MSKQDPGRKILSDGKEVTIQEAIEEHLRMCAFPYQESDILPILQARGYVVEIKGVWCITQEGIQYQKKLRLGPFRYWVSKNGFALAVLGLTFLSLVLSTGVGVCDLLRG